MCEKSPTKGRGPDDIWRLQWEGQRGGIPKADEVKKVARYLSSINSPKSKLLSVYVSHVYWHYSPSSGCWRLRRRWWLQGGECRRCRPRSCRRTNHKWRFSWKETETRRPRIPEDHTHNRHTAITWQLSSLSRDISWPLKFLPKHRRIFLEPARV